MFKLISRSSQYVIWRSMWQTIIHIKVVSCRGGWSKSKQEIDLEPQQTSKVSDISPDVWQLLWKKCKVGCQRNFLFNGNVYGFLNMRNKNSQKSDHTQLSGSEKCLTIISCVSVMLSSDHVLRMLMKLL